MAQVINTNVASLFGQNALIKSSNGLQTAMQRLSSGLRINSAKDDITGMKQALGYDNTVRGANMAIRTANDGISQAQINDGYYQQISDNLQRIRELAVQAGGTLTTASDAWVEASALAAENARINSLVPTAAAQVVIDANGTQLSMTGKQATLSIAASATSITIANLDADITTVTTTRANYGADMARLSSAASVLGTQSVNTSAAYSRVMDTDYAAETTNMTRNQILQQAGTAMLAQANQVPSYVLQLLR
jgi:flagellin